MAESIENQQPPEMGNAKLHRSRSGFWIGIIVFLTVAVFAAGGFFLWQQLREAQEGLGGEIDKGDKQLLELSRQISGNQEQLAALQKQLATLQEQIAEKDKQINQTIANYSKSNQDKAEALRNEMATAMSQIQRQLGKTRGDWLLADAEYLLGIAGQRLHLTGDVATTREALLAADERLRESGDAGVFKVREELAKEIMQLDKIKAADIVGIYASLQVLAGQADGLTLASPYADKEINKPQQAAATDGEPSAADGWFAHLKGLVTVRHNDQPVNKILTPEQAYFIKEQLKVKLEMMQIALVQQNEDLFKANLADTRKWLQANFAMDNNAKEFQKGLDKLEAVKIVSQMPDISQSLKMLRNITKLRLDADKAAFPANNRSQPKPTTVAPPNTSTQP